MKFIFTHNKIKEEKINKNMVLGITKSNIGLFNPISWTLEEFLKNHDRKEINNSYATAEELQDGRIILK